MTVPTGAPTTSVLLPDLETPFWTELHTELRAQADFEVLTASVHTDGPDVPMSPLPEVILIEPGHGPPCVAGTLRTCGDGQDDTAKVLVVTDKFDPYAPPLCEHVHGALSKNHTAREVSAAIRIVAGGYWLSAGSTAGEARSHGDDSRLPTDYEAVGALSDRELDVLRLIAGGYSNAEISRKLFLSTSTVKSHIQRLFGKLGIKNRTQAVIYAYESGITTSTAHYGDAGRSE